MTLKVAVVGLGGIGNRHASIYHGHDGVEVVAVCDIDQERSDKAAEKYGCPGFYSIQDMVNSGITRTRINLLIVTVIDFCNQFEVVAYCFCLYVNLSF